MPHAVLRKSLIILVTQGQEVKPRIIIMKTICLYHLMLPEILGAGPRWRIPVETLLVGTWRVAVG